MPDDLKTRFGRLSQASWLDEERTVNYSRILCCFYGIAILGWIALSPGFVDPNGKPLGTDFMDVWAAGKLALAGDPAAAYDYARHYEVQRHALNWHAGETAPYFGWHYPPMFLLIAAPLALLPYGLAVALWMALTLPLYLVVIRQIVPHRHWLIVALAFPAVFVNLGHGQNGFLTTALLGAALLVLGSRPFLAGVFLGLLSYKPQFGILIPLALVVGFYWRTFLAAAATTIVVALASYAAFGLETWRAFFASLRLTRGYVLEQGATGWEKIQSAFSAVRMLGGSIEAAYAVQAAVFALAAVAVVIVWRQPGKHALKASILATASLLATPYVLDYDLMVLALPIAWLIAEARQTGFLTWEKAGLALCFLLPLVSRSIGSLGVPIGPFAMLLLLALIVRRSRAPISAPAADNLEPLRDAAVPILFQMR